MSSYTYDADSKILVGVGLHGIALGIKKTLNIDIDMQESQFNPRVSRIVTDKGLVANKTWSQALKELVKLGEGVLQDGTAISRSGVGLKTKYYVRFKSIPSQEEEVVEEVVVISEDVVAESSEEELPVSDKLVPDLEYAQKLYDEDDERGSRTKLDEYAEQFGIKLSARKRFDNMMLDFKAAIEESK